MLPVFGTWWMRLCWKMRYWMTVQRGYREIVGACCWYICCSFRRITLLSLLCRCEHDLSVFGCPFFFFISRKNGSFFELRHNHAATHPQPRQKTRQKTRHTIQLHQQQQTEQQKSCKLDHLAGREKNQCNYLVRNNNHHQWSPKSLSKFKQYFRFCSSRKYVASWSMKRE